MLLAQSTAFIIGPIAKLLGLIINALYNVLDYVGIGNVALSIILFTIIVQLLMIPIKYKAQKFTRISSMIQPEIMEIRKKYAGKRDQQSMALMNQETQAVYRRYGTSAAGGCLPMLIQMPILFALYAVIQSVPSYVDKVGSLFGQVADKIIAGNYIDTLSAIKGVEHLRNINISDAAQLAGNKTLLVDYLYSYNISSWNSLVDKITDIPRDLIDSILGIMKFAGDVLISDTPWQLIQENGYIHWIWIIPVLVYASAYFSIKTTQTNNNNDDNPAAKQMKTMSTIMPIISVVFSIMLPVGLGIYWIANSLLMGIQQIFMNKYIDKIGIENIVSKNIERNKEKIEKQKMKEGINPATVTKAANLNTKNIKNSYENNSNSENENNNPKSLSALAKLTDKYKND